MKLNMSSKVYFLAEILDTRAEGCEQNKYEGMI